MKKLLALTITAFFLQGCVSAYTVKDFEKPGYAVKAKIHGKADRGFYQCVGSWVKNNLKVGSEVGVLSITDNDITSASPAEFTQYIWRVFDNSEGIQIRVTEDLIFDSDKNKLIESLKLATSKCLAR